MRLPNQMFLQVVLLVLCAVSFYKYVNRPLKLRSVAIVVLGDVGRSPRMMYHAESFAKLGFNTYLIGYRGELPTASLGQLLNNATKSLNRCLPSLLYPTSNFVTCPNRHPSSARSPLSSRRQ